MADGEHFGVIGLKIGDEIYYKPHPKIVVYVSAGDGTREGGARLVKHDLNGKDHYSLRLLTRRLMNLERLPENFDYWACWIYKDKTLRELIEENKK